MICERVKVGIACLGPCRRQTAGAATDCRDEGRRGQAALQEGRGMRFHNVLRLEVRRNGRDPPKCPIEKLTASGT